MASSLADSIAVACIDENAALNMMRNREGPDKLYFLGWVWAKHLGRPRNVMLEDFNGYYEHPVTGDRRNPKDDFIEYHKDKNYHLKSNQINFAEWDPYNEDEDEDIFAE